MKNFESENFDAMVKELDKELKKSGLTRREALKLLGIGSGALLLTPSESSAATRAEASSAKGKIVIVGGGAAGITVAAQLSNKLSNPDITLIAPNEIHLYQPGQTLIAAGLWKESDIQDKNANYMPSNVKWVKDKVAQFDAAGKKVVTSKGEAISYDYLVIATGIEYAYEKIEGLSADKIGSHGVASIYLNDLDKGTAVGAIKCWEQLQAFGDKAKKEKVVGLFSDGLTPIKCGGAPKKIQYLTDGYLRKLGGTARDNATLDFYTPGEKMFGVPEFHDAIVKQYEARKMKFFYSHKLKAVDTDKQVAIFEKTSKVQGKYDELLKEYEMIEQKENVEIKFDLLHVVPPMKAPEVVKNSDFSFKKGSAAGFGAVEVDKHTLQHLRYKEVFGIGDVIGVPVGKTGGSVRKQAPVLVENLIAVMEGKEPKAQYHGYTVCPLITGYGTVMMAEFDYNMKVTPSFPLDATQERWIWWLLKVYMLKPMYFMGMLKGRA
ncbi:MAG: NAD(P)/FAD-dependent oxidoreductase [Campylobacterales bacterium]|nr:NAD(P)/FAD-dependent oxidoreductase [Campylobacterales bacterium]